jgi:hypothetical protein
MDMVALTSAFSSSRKKVAGTALPRLHKLLMFYKGTALGVCELNTSMQCHKYYFDC